MLISRAYQIARMNEQTTSGTQQEGVTSGEQVKALNEAPMSTIRALQGNFQEFIAGLTNKMIVMAQMHYTVPRMVKVAGGIARIPAAGQGNIEFIPQQGDEYLVQQIQEIKGDLTIGDYEVEVISGSEIPRSRAENAKMILMMYQGGMLGQSIETLEEVFNTVDLPNRQHFLDRLKKERDEAKAPTIYDNKDLADGFAKIMAALSGFSGAKAEAMNAMGIKATTVDTLATAPAQEISAKGSPTQLSLIAPQKVSDDPEQNMMAQQVAAGVVARQPNRGQ